MAGLFITFEGMDGAGKTTQIQLLKQYFEKKGNKVYVTREPGGTNISEAIRELLLSVNNSEMHLLTEVYLYAAARAQHINEVIMPKLSEGYIVLCDRFLDSSLAYQGYGRGLSYDTVLGINAYAVGDFMPDITFYLYIDKEERLKRKQNMTLDRIEREADKFHERVFNGYEEIYNKNKSRIKKIDGSCSILEVFAAICEHINHMKEGVV